MPDLDLMFILGVLPFGFCALLAAFRKLLAMEPENSVIEDAMATLMVASYVLGIIVLICPNAVPPAPLPIQDWVEPVFPDPIPIDTTVTTSNSFTIMDAIIPLLISIYLLGVIWYLIPLTHRLISIALISGRAKATFEKGVFVSDLPGTAFVAPTGRIIFSRAFMESVTRHELSLILAHERAHKTRLDPLRFLILAILDVVFWFNPFLRHQSERCRTAAELECDRIVVEKAPEMRRVYAETLVSALKHAAGNALHCVPAAFSMQSKGDYRMRMEHILQSKPKMGKRTRTALIAGTLGLLTGFGTLQVAIAEGGPTVTPFTMSFMPTEGRVSSKFGQRVHPVTKEPAFHNGMDIAAPYGTPVKATSPGDVTFASERGAYGNVVEIEHGNGIVTRYAQLEACNVSVGDRVTEGTVIGTVGASGQATGPHLHFEVIENGEPKAPASYLNE